MICIAKTRKLFGFIHWTTLYWISPNQWVTEKEMAFGFASAEDAGKRLDWMLRDMTWNAGVEFANDQRFGFTRPYILVSRCYGKAD